MFELHVQELLLFVENANGMCCERFLAKGPEMKREKLLFLVSKGGGRRQENVWLFWGVPNAL